VNVRFTTKSTGGTAALTLTSVTLYDASFNSILNSKTNGTITVSSGTVPSPTPTLIPTPTRTPTPTPPSQTAPAVSVQPASQTAAANSPANISVNITTAPQVLGFDITLNYNPALLSIASAADITIGTFLPGGSLAAPAIDNTAGVVYLGGYVSGTTGGTGSGPLVNVRFTTKSTGGTAALTLTSVTLYDASFNSILNSKTNGTITVGP